MIIVKEKYERGFTLLEVMIAILIIGIIASITIVNHMDESRSKAEFANLKTKWVINEGKYIEKLIGKWSFDEGSGTATRDSSSYERSGQIVGATWKEEKDCVLGRCLIFDGVDDYVNLGNSETLKTVNKFTISFWFNLSNATNSNFFYRANREGLYPRGGAYGQTANFQYRLTVGGATATRTITSTEILSLNQWHHYVGIIDTTVGGKLYIDGKLIGSNIDIGDGTGIITGGVSEVLIGRDTNLTRWMNGMIDEVAIYSDVVSLAGIESEYLAGISNLLTKGLITKEDYDFRVASMEDSKVTDLKITKR
ncbi:MAG: hypothetical protein BWY21_00476 [Parcubacteria group bacterium ADurb.Bin216]|nr:MAG: hypothetical protein BWY21_00476 [Parcubacteria group bacterium ADurb.Bin216]